MPVYSKSLMKLTAYLAAAASVEYPMDVSTIAAHTGISGSNIRLLFKQHSDMFHFTKVGNVLCYFLVPNEKAQRILTAAARVNGSVNGEELSALSELAYPQGGIAKISQAMTPSPTPVNNPPAVAKQPHPTPVHSSAVHSSAEHPIVAQYKKHGLKVCADEVAAAWNIPGSKPYTQTDIEKLTNTVHLLTAIADLINERIRELA